MATSPGQRATVTLLVLSAPEKSAIVVLFHQKVGWRSRVKFRSTISVFAKV
jgi:hypothetical protein